MKKITILGLFLISLLSLVSSQIIIGEEQENSKADLTFGSNQIIIEGANYSINVNNSECWDGNCAPENYLPYAYNHSSALISQYGSNWYNHSNVLINQYGAYWYNMSDGSYNVSYVPYTGATGNVNLGSNTITAGGGTYNGQLNSDIPAGLGLWHRYTVLNGVFPIGRVTSENGVFQIMPENGFDLWMGNFSTSVLALGHTSGNTQVYSQRSFYAEILGGGRTFETNATGTKVFTNLTIGQLAKLTPYTNIPNCDASTNVSIASNNTGIYYCFNNNWRRMD